MLLYLFLSLGFAGIPNGVSLTNLKGESVQAKQYTDNVILFVNVASRCGYTRQYKGLQELYEKYKDRGLVIMGVPCNQFGGQEPGSPKEIQTFCSKNYDVSFPLLEKQDVNGDNRSPLYKTLIKDGPNIKWNFEKILVDKSGKTIARFSSSTAPLSEDITKKIEAALGRQK